MCATNALALNARTIGGHLRNIRHKTKSTRFELMRGVFEMRDDSDVGAYLAALTRRLVGRKPGLGGGGSLPMSAPTSNALTSWRMEPTLVVIE